MRPVIDMESLTTIGGVKHIPSNAGDWAYTWLTIVKDGIVYASTSYWEEMLRQRPALSDEPWWRAEYHQTCPQEMPPGPPAVALQWTGTGRIDGVSGDADLDMVYADTLDALLA